MSNLNAEQKDLCNKTEGFVIVDAGPGTGKTFSIVDRYINILKKNIDPLKVLMLTFTRNAAEEMKTRTTDRITTLLKSGDNGILANALKNLKVSTIDSFCLDIVQNSPETIRDFFEPDDDNIILSRSAAMIENETLNKQYFMDYYSHFIRDRGDQYVTDENDVPAALGEDAGDLFDIIGMMMARGIIPKKKGWYGYAKDLLVGKPKKLMETMSENRDRITERLGKILDSDWYNVTDLAADYDLDDVIQRAANDDRELLIKFVHDLYYGYIVQSIRDNRLTFGLCELFAYIVLLNDDHSRKMHSVSYLTIDEFQDTNELQMKICLMVLDSPNMCVVGDWKQGIFGFRFVSIDNIQNFGPYIEKYMEELSENGIKFTFGYSEPYPINFRENYRSSQKILDLGFESLDILLEGEKKPDRKPVTLTPVNQKFIGDMTKFRCIKGRNGPDEIGQVVDQIAEYVNSGDYPVVEVYEEDGEFKSEIRDMGFGDIAVLCKSNEKCKAIADECERKHIPAVLQDDVQIMSTREGILTLAWLRFINDDVDKRGLVTILTEEGYPYSEIQRIVDSGGKEIPDDIKAQYSKLRGKMKRHNDLITSIFEYYKINNEYAQAIISVIADTYGDSLITISDIIRLIEDDISAGTKYSVDAIFDRTAVTIQTLHKSKGLEYPAVIIAGVNNNSLPKVRPKKKSFIFNDLTGIRTTNSFLHTEKDGKDYNLVLESWKTAVVLAGMPIDFSEERRLLFVGMTRAKQYLAMSGGYSTSEYFKHYAAKHPPEVPEPSPVNHSSDDSLAHTPAIAPYTKNRMSISVHDLMSVLPEPDGAEKKKGKGQEYGEMVHQKAYLYLKWKRYDESVEEMKVIRELIDSLQGAELSGEIRCVLPVDDVSIKGTIDLIAEFDDRIEIHDYKTDPTTAYLDRYMLQLSVYAAAAASRGKKVKCYLHFVTIGEKKVFDPYPMDYIRKCVDDYKEWLKRPL